MFADADWDSAVDHVLTGVFLHSGQVCSAGTRLIVEESIADDFVADLAARAEKIRIGDGMDPASETGPLVSEQHRAKVEAHVQQGISEGAKLVTGGARPTDPALAKGSFYLPTIFDRCDRSMRIVQEETFGPILTVERFTTEAEAIALGNDTEYGLAAGVRTSDPARGERVVRALRHGTVWLNDFGYYTAAAEWGGFGKSGNGRELGPTGLAEYQEIKHIWHNTAPATRRLVQGELPGGLERTTQSWSIKESARRQRRWRTSATRSRSTAASASSPASRPGVSYISILTGTFQLFYFGFGTAGPAYLWSWPMVFVGQMAVALCFMELAAKYPVAGSVYNWSKKLGSRLVGWSSGWLMLTASIVTLSAVVLAYQLNLPRLWSGFQIIGDGTGEYDFAANAVLLGTVLIAFTTRDQRARRAS